MDPEEIEEIKRKEDEDAHKSGVDRANDLLNKTRRVRQLKQGASGLRAGSPAAEGAAESAGAATAGGAAEGAATAGGAAAAEGAATAGGAAAAGGVPLIVIGLIALLIAVVFIAIIGSGNVNSENIVPTASQDCQVDLGGTCQAAGSTCVLPNIPDTSGAICSNQATPLCCIPPASGGNLAPPVCSSGDYYSCLKNQYGITMKGNFTSSDLKKIYNGFGIGFKYPVFLAWFKSVQPTVVISPYAVCPSSQWCSGAWATVQTGAIMTLYQNFMNAGTRYQRYVLVHEAGHMAAQANSTASNAQYILYKNAYTNGQARSCYNGIGIIDTYPWHVIQSSQLNFDRKVRESWAESIADTVLCPANTTCPSNGGGGTSISDFPGTCSYIYNYVTNALGG